MPRLILFLVIFFNLSFSNEYIIGFAQANSKNDWGKIQLLEINKEIKKFKNLKIINRDAKGKVSKQLMHMEEFINKKVDFIITNPINSQLSSKALKRAIEKNIKVILIDRKISSDDYTSFISSNDKLIAEKSAIYLSKKLNNKGTILILEGTRGASVTKNRTKYFNKYIKENTNINIILQNGAFLRSKAMKIMENIYKNQIAFDAIYSHSDSMLAGARTVLKKYYKNKDIPSIGINYTKEAKSAIEKKEQNISFLSNSSIIKSINTINKLIHNKQINKNAYVKTIMVSKENVHTINAKF